MRRTILHPVGIWSSLGKRIPRSQAQDAHTASSAPAAVHVWVSGGGNWTASAVPRNAVADAETPIARLCWLYIETEGLQPCETLHCLEYDELTFYFRRPLYNRQWGADFDGGAADIRRLSDHVGAIPPTT